MIRWNKKEKIFKNGYQKLFDYHRKDRVKKNLRKNPQYFTIFFLIVLSNLLMNFFKKNKMKWLTMYQYLKEE